MSYDPLQPLPKPLPTEQAFFQINTPEDSIYGSSVTFGNTRITTAWGVGAQIQITQRQIGQLQIIDIN